MAVARVASAESIRTGTEDPYEFSYAGGTPQGIAIGVIHGEQAAALVSSGSYGGVALSLIVEANDTLAEPGVAQIWFLGSGVPAGTQTVSLDLTSASAVDIHVVVWELSGSADLEVIDSDEQNEDAGVPRVTLQSGGRTKICLAALYAGIATPGGVLEAGNTLDHTHDFGAFISQTCFETTVDNADHLIGWDYASGVDDLAFVAIAVSEVVGGSITGTIGVTQEDQVAAFAGAVANPVTGTIAVVQEDQVAVFSGAVANPVTGTIGVTQADQIAAFSGTVSNPFVPPVPGADTNRMGGSGAIRKPPRNTRR